MKNKITIYDIAKTAGVSPATVSRMIHQPDIVAKNTRKKILDAFALHHIYPEDLKTKEKLNKSTKQKRAGQNSTILVCIPVWDNPFYYDILDGISDCLGQFQCHMLVTQEVPDQDNMLSFLNYCASIKASGIIMMHPLSENILRQLISFYPLVQCSEHNPYCEDVPYVSIDDYTISKAAVAYLISLGCRNIGFFSASYDYQYVQNRYRAYKTMLTMSGMTINPQYVVQVYDFSYERILSAANHFFEIPDPPDSVFATSDKHAHAVIKAALYHGLSVPQDLKVFGFDNTSYASLSTPTISTVEQPRRQIGIESATMLLNLIKNPTDRVKPMLLNARLVLQEST